MSNATEGLGAEGSELPDVSDERYWIGKVVGHFRLVRKLGEGGQGSVYQAEHIHLQQNYAIKLLHMDEQTHPSLIERFRREAQTTARLQHAHVVQIADFGQLSDGGFYMAMELLHGKSLQACIDEHEFFSLPSLIGIFGQLCEALQFAHQQHIFHRDLKPDNIFLVRDETRHDFVKVIDFGIAAVKETNVKLTRSNAFIGTPAYMSPEQAQGKVKDFDGRSDLYTVALILFELLAGRKPFVGRSFLDLAFQHASMPAPTLADVDSMRIWSPTLEAFFVTALAKSRDERPVGAAIFWQLCHNALLAQQRLEDGEDVEGGGDSDWGEDTVRFGEDTVNVGEDTANVDEDTANVTAPKEMAAVDSAALLASDATAAMDVPDFGALFPEKSSNAAFANDGVKHPAPSSTQPPGSGVLADAAQQSSDVSTEGAPASKSQEPVPSVDAAEPMLSEASTVVAMQAHQGEKPKARPVALWMVLLVLLAGVVGGVVWFLVK